MKQLFIDTANLNEIIDANEMGIIQGVTTNPSIIAKEPKGDFDNLIINLAKYCGNNNLSFSVEIFSTKFEDIVLEAKNLNNKLKTYCNDLYIKIPVGYEELKAIKVLSKNGINVNCTCCYTESQLNMASFAGAKYVSLFYARLKDIGGNPNIVLKNTSSFIDQNKSDTKIIAGSIRTPFDVLDSWNNGAHIVTTGLSVIKQLYTHPQTTSSVNKFLEDFKNWRSQ